MPHANLTKELALLSKYRSALKSRHRTRANKAADALLILLQPLISHIARAYRGNIAGKGLFTEADLHQLAQLGALESFKSFDPERGSFTAHCSRKIHNAIRKQLYKHQAVRHSYHDYRGDSKSPRPPKPTMVSEPTETQDPDEPTDWLGDLSYQQHQTDGTDSNDPETLTINDERDAAVQIALATLPPKTRQLLLDIYGFTDARKRLTPKEQAQHDQAMQELRELITGEFTDYFESLYDSDLDT